MEEGYRACPYCAEPIRVEATVCKHCNRKLVRSARAFRFAVLGALAAAALGWFIYSRVHAREVDLENEKVAARMATMRVPGVPENKQGIAPSQLEPPTRSISPTEIFDTYSPSVVLLENYNGNNQLFATGSGFCVGVSVVATNYHVIRGASRLVARDRDSNTYEASDIESYDPDKDVAIVKFSGLHLAPLVLADAAEAKRGEHVTAIGAPLGIQNTVSDGMITNLLTVGGVSAIQTSAPISHGSSGGPLFDDYGRVLGVTSATRPEGELVNFAMPSAYLKRLLDSAAPMGLQQFLAETRVVTPILQGSVSVRQGTAVPLAFSIPPNHVAAIEGQFSIKGGIGNDITWGLVQALPNGQMVQIIRLAPYSSQCTISRSLQAGRYALVLDNRSSPIFSRTIAGTVNLTDFR